MTYWYSRLLAEMDGLFSKYPPEMCMNKFIVQRNRLGSKKNIERKYALFDSPRDYWEWSESQVNPSCFEVIQGAYDQKIHFDIDIKVSESEDAYAIADEVLLNVLGSLEYLGVKKEHVYLYESNGKENYRASFHIVVQKWHCSNNTEAKLVWKFCNNRLPQHLQQYLDHAVYSSAQCFRLVGSAKIGTTRFKKLTKHWPITRKSEGDYIDFVMSLVGQFHEETQHISDLPRYADLATLIQTRANEIEIIDIPEEVLEKVKTMVEEHPQLTPGHAKLTKISEDKNERKILIYRRIFASKCPLCEGRIHEHENPYVFVVQNEPSIYNAYYSCRRDAITFLHLGSVLLRNRLFDVEHGKQIVEIKVDPEKRKDQKKSMHELQLNLLMRSLVF